MVEIHLHAKYAVRELSKARKVVLHLVQRPGREQHGQTGTVCNLIAERGQLMLKLMHREQALAAAAGVIVMRNAARPHQGSAGFVVARIGDCPAAGIAHGNEQTFGNTVGNVAFAAFRREVTLERVHHDVHNAAAGLEFGHGIGVLRIKEADARTVGLARDTALLLGLLIGEYAGVAAFRAGGRQRQYSADRQGGIRLCAGRCKLPRISFGGNAHGDGLRRVDYRAAADCQHKVDALSLCQCNALANKRYLRVRRYTAQFNKGKTRRKQAFFHTVEQTGRACARAAEVH